MRTYNTLIAIAVFSIILSLFSVNAQNNIGQIWQCNTAKSTDVTTKEQSNAKSLNLLAVSVDTTSLKGINVFVHVLRMDDGSGGLTQSQINDWMALFYNDYMLHHIIIRIVGQSNFNNSTFYGGITDANYSSLINTDTHANAIDIYLLSPSDNYSRASNIPGVALAVGGSYQGTSVLSHEFGHCLGLFHTHSGSGCSDNANCAENIDESNCLTCGDLICDTPADPCLSGKVDVNCQYIGDSRYRPDVHNIMSYAPPLCLSHLTPDQVVRIHSTISYSSIFTTRCFAITISGPSQICTQGTYTIDNLPAGATVVWSTTPSGVVSYSTSGSSVTLTKVGSAKITLSATINNSFTVTKDISVGTPYSLSISGYSNLTMWDAGDFQVLPSGGYFPYEGVLSLSDGTGLATSYIWSFVSSTPGKVVSWSPNGGSVDVAMKTTNTFLHLKCTASNSCGSYSQIYTFTTGTIQPMIVTPNPASSQVEVSIADDASPVSTSSLQASTAESSITSTYTIAVVDSYGSTVYSAIKKEKKFNISTASFRNGIYAVIVSDGVNTYQSKLIVKH